MYFAKRPTFFDTEIFLDSFWPVRMTSSVKTETKKSFFLRWCQRKSKVFLFHLRHFDAPPMPKKVEWKFSATFSRHSPQKKRNTKKVPHQKGKYVSGLHFFPPSLPPFLVILLWEEHKEPFLPTPLANSISSRRRSGFCALCDDASTPPLSRRHEKSPHSLLPFPFFPSSLAEIAYELYTRATAVASFQKGCPPHTDKIINICF